MINSRDIHDLAPDVAALCEAFVQACKEAGCPVLVTSTYRDKASQNELYAKGRTAPGPKVTNLQGGRSFHQYHVAFDFVPVDEHGHPVWNDDDLWEKCGAIGESIGLEWGGTWNSFVDRPHMQLTGGKTIQQFWSEQEGDIRNTSIGA